MIEYRLDPKNPRQLMPEEQEQLDKARIDYTDIPPLDDALSRAHRAMADDPKRARYGPEAIGILRGLDPPIQRSSVEIGSEIDWSQCEDVESVPDRCHGEPVVKGTRVMVQGIIDNADAGCSAEEIAREIYDLDLEAVRRILAFAQT